MGTESKLHALLGVARWQTEAAARYVEAESAKSSGDYRGAVAAYERHAAAARAHLDAALGFNRRFPDSPFDLPPIVRPLVNALMVEADLLQALNEREAADARRRQALELSRTHLGVAGSAETERSRAASLTLEGRFNEAMVALMGARDVVVAQGDLLAVARVTIDLADLLQWLGDFARAKQEIEHAERLIAPRLAGRQPQQVDVMGAVLSSLSSIMSGQGDDGAAQRSVELYRAAVEVKYYHGLISRALEEWDEAERSMREVLPEYAKLGSGEAIEYQLAQIERGRGEVDAALARLARIAPAFERHPYRAKRGVLQRVEAECRLELGDLAAARRAIDASVADLVDRHFDPDALWRSQWTEARVRAAEGDEAAAGEAFRRAIGTIDDLRRAPLGYRLDSTFLDDKLALYTQAVEHALDSGAAADGCRFIESLKSRTLNAVLSIPAAAAGTGSQLEADLARVTRRLDTLEYQAYREGWSRERRVEHRALLATRADLLERIRIGDPRWRTLTHAPPFDLDALLERLGARAQAALALNYEAPRLHAVLLFDGKLASASLTLAERTVGAVRDYAANLQKRTYDPFKNDLSAHYGLAAADLLPAPLLARALAAESLVVVPHRDLHLVPWAGLVHEGERLFERLPVGVMPSLATLASRREPAAARHVCLVGVSSYPGAEDLDLPNARREIEEIAPLYAAAGAAVPAPLLDAEATEAAFWERARTADGEGGVLHLSCHGTMVPREPMSSGLLLADSKVDAAEIAAARLPYDEVVLSACSTGWRPTRVGDVVLDADEVLGIPAGFLEGGAGSVLVSIPKAEGGSARRLTTRYHARRAAGAAPLAALNQAQREMLADDASPATWIGFTLYGGW